MVRTLTALKQAARGRMTAAGAAVSGEMEQYAKQAAPWQDRTGNARRTLTGFCQGEGDSIHIGLAGQMPYSPNLELGFGRRFAVLTPTAEAFAPVIMERLRSALAGMDEIRIED